ncbi:Rv1733c family protein [Actinophytocola sp. KF-1]
MRAELRGLLRPGNNPLVRDVDRVERVTVLACVALAVLLIPVALVVGALTYRGLTGAAAEEAATHHRTVAVLTEDLAAPGARGYAGSTTPSAHATWRAPDGTARAGVVPVRGGMAAGDTVDVWLDETGAPTAPPMSTSDAVGTGIAVAAFGWLGAAGLLALACYGLHTAFERRRMRGWAAGWAAFEHERSR